MATVASYYQEITEQGESIGTVHSLLMKGGKVIVNPYNLAREDKKVLVRLVSANGKQELKLIASPTVSKLLRTKEITFANLLSFPVKETIAKDGSEIKSICMPEGAGMIEIAEKGIKVEEWTPEAVNHDDIIAM
jgi:hypothetical protein